jgi:uncharacterized phage infection (PIP) family protein YhgE
MEQLLTNLGGLAGVGVLAGGFGIAYAQFRSGSTKAKDELIVTLKETAEAEQIKAERLAEEKRVLMDSHQKQINELTEKIGKLQGLYESAEKRNKEMLEILQGRNPEQKEFVEMMRKATQNSKKVTDDATSYMKKSIEILGEIQDFMKQLNQKAKENEERNDRVDNGPAHERDNMIKNIERRSKTNEERNVSQDKKKTGDHV